MVCDVGIPRIQMTQRNKSMTRSRLERVELPEFGSSEPTFEQSSIPEGKVRENGKEHRAALVADPNIVNIMER